MGRLQDENLEHQHVVERRAPALRSVRSWHGARQIRTEQLEIDNGVQPLEVITLGRELLQSLVNVEKPALAPHSIPPDSTGARESHQPGNREVLGGVQLHIERLQNR